MHDVEGVMLWVRNGAFLQDVCGMAGGGVLAKTSRSIGWEGRVCMDDSLNSGEPNVVARLLVIPLWWHSVNLQKT